MVFPMFMEELFRIEKMKLRFLGTLQLMGCKPRLAFKSSLRPSDANGTSRTGSIDDFKGDCVNNVTRYVFSSCGCPGISSGPAKEVVDQAFLGSMEDVNDGLRLMATS
ncbi:hypothetical protein C4D60_Mb08t33590 [Musa balbisiana]|uniref:Uncharacterized protein n=1 Tax=Musa balbisiana TaxID=52838 RepID=A0A4S8K8C5_MUSBA|nr:hypothetical protein C4D60_Mb08t33590 [Musa balbisiana]